MWVLDINIPAQVGPVLKSLNIPFKFAANQGWGTLTNGELVEASHAAGFSCILTKDARFDESAREVLKKFTTIAIVRLSLPQAPGRNYANSFRLAWQKSPIVPAAGKLLIWP